MKIDKDIKKIFIFGLFIRFLFMPFAGFIRDLGYINYVSHIFASGHFDIYRFIAEKYGGNIIDRWAYFPLGYVILGGFNWVLQLFLPELVWEKWYESDVAFRAIFLSKIPYLVFDIAIGWLLYKYFKKDDINPSFREEWSTLAFKLWWLNPVVIFTSYVFAQFDVIVTFFAFSAVLVATKYARAYSGALLLALGGLTKSIPMFILPLLAFSPDIKGKKKLFAFMIGLGVLFLGILPFISYEPFRSQILFTPHTGRLFALNFAPLGARDTTLIFVVLYAFLFLWYTASGDTKKMNLIEASFVLFSMFFITVNFHPQYFIWFIPFAIIISIERGYAHILKYLYLFFFLALIQWKFEWVYLEPITPINRWEQMSAFALIGRFYDSQQFVNVSRSILSGILIFLIFVTLTRRTSSYINRSLRLGLGLRSKMILILSLILTTAFLFFPFDFRKDTVSQNANDSMIGVSEVPVTQSFVEEGKEIRKIRIDTRMAQVAPEKKQDIVIEILDSMGNTILKTTMKTVDLSGDRWITLPFRGLPVEKGGKYMIKIYASSPVKEPFLFLKYSSKDVYDQGELAREGEGVIGDLAFRVVDRELMVIIDNFYPRLLKDKPFLIIYSIIMAAMFIVILK